MFNLTKKGAMFGLDARIAIILFVSISAIAFSSFYSAISSSNATQYLNDMKSIKQAYDNFRTDTGYKLTSYTNPYYYNVSELVTLAVDNNKPYTKKYNGPYLEYNLTGSNNFIAHPVLKNNIAFVSRSFNTDWATQAHPDTAKCSSNDCFTWLVVYDVKKDIAIALDESLDHELSENTGKLRLIANGDNYDVFMPLIAE